MSGKFQDFEEDAESDAGDFNPTAEDSDNDDSKPIDEQVGSIDNYANVEQSEITNDDDIKYGADKEDTRGADSTEQQVDDGEGNDSRDELGSQDAGEDAEGPGEDIDNNENRDEDDEEEDDEDEEEDPDDAGPTRKRRKRKGNQFIDVEAEVDDDEELEDDEDEEREADFVADTHPDDEGLDAATERDDRGHRELDMKRQREVEMDAEKEAERLRRKYGRNQAASTNAAITPQSYLVPSVNDPSIWGCKCKPGKEKEVVLSLMRRQQERLGTRDQLEICSVFERGESIPGFIYVEAFRQSSVLAACDGVQNLYTRSTKLTLVPIGEMPDLLRVRKSKTLEPGMYVRIKRGKYQGDLAQVEDVMENGLEVDLRLIPRLDYGTTEDSNTAFTGPDALKRKRAAGFAKNTVAGRPPARLFSESEAQKRNGKYLQQQSTYSSKEFIYMGDKFINGFLHKSFKIQHVQTEDVNPTLEEVNKFKSSTEDGEETLDLNALAATIKQGNTASAYLLNDVVEIFQGEQQGVTGVVASVHGDIVSLKVTEGDLKDQVIEAPANIIRKSFRVGTHVTVTSQSKYRGESGFVERIKDDRVTLLTDSGNQQITVFSKDLREADDAVDMPLLQKQQGYSIFDLVRTDNTTVGVILKADREYLRVLDQNGAVQTIPVSGVQTKIEKRRFDVTLDRDGAEIRHDDVVKEIGGQQRQGRVLHIARSYLFLQDRSRTANSGVFVVRNHSVVSTAAQQNRANGAAQGTARPNSQAAMPPPPRQYGRDRSIGKTCRVRRGAKKGLIGIIKDANESEVRVELHGQKNVATFPKDMINIIDPETGQTMETLRSGASRQPPNFPMRTGLGTDTSRVPAWDAGSRTPAMNGGRTPGWGGDGGRTPAWAGAGAGNKTPAWKTAAAGGRTPAYMQRNDGSRTAYGGGGGGAADGGRTAYGGGAGGTTSYGGVSNPPIASTVCLHHN